MRLVGLLVNQTVNLMRWCHSMREGRQRWEEQLLFAGQTTTPGYLWPPCYSKAQSLCSMLPGFSAEGTGTPNEAGIAYYNRLIDLLLREGACECRAESQIRALHPQ